jgi:hypothetical protein
VKPPLAVLRPGAVRGESGLLQALLVTVGELVEIGLIAGVHLGGGAGAEELLELFLGDAVLPDEGEALGHLPDLVDGVLLLGVEAHELCGLRRHLELLGPQIAAAAQALGRGEQVVGRAVDDRQGDVAAAEEEVHQCPGLGRVARPGAGLGRGVGEGVREVLVRPDAVGGVLVELAVAVVVPALGLDPVGAGPLLHGVGLDHDAGIDRIGEPVAGRIGDPHAGDPAVAVEVVRRVFPEEAVDIVIDLQVVAAAADAKLAEDRVVGVGVERRGDVEGGRGEELRRGAASGLLDQIADQVERRLGAGVVEAGDVGADEDRRPEIRIGAAGRGDAGDPERPAASRLADGEQLHLARVRPAPVLELPFDGGERVVVLERSLVMSLIMSRVARGRAGGTAQGQQAEGGGRRGGPQAGEWDSHGHLLRKTTRGIDRRNAGRKLYVRVDGKLRSRIGTSLAV